MSEAWAVIVSIILILVIYGIVSSKLTKRKRRKMRENTIPMISDFPKTGIQYNIHLSDGRTLTNAEILGDVEPEDGQFTFAGFDGMLVVALESGKKAYLKKTAVRYVEET